MNPFSEAPIKQSAAIERFAAVAGNVGVGPSLSAKRNGRDKCDLAKKSLFESARLGDAEGFKIALPTGVDVDAKDERGLTASMIAARYGRDACLASLIAARADPDAKDHDGWTASMLAAHHGHLACLGLLIAAGADVDANDGDGSSGSALALAAENGQADCLALLIAARADLDAKDNDGWSPAMRAAAHGHRDCLLLLISAGADLGAKDDEGSTASMIAAENGHHGLSSLVDGSLARKEAAELDFELSSALAGLGPARRPPRV